MLGAIFGDIVGSTYEFHNTHDYNFKLLTRWSEFTDDSCMTLAVAKALCQSMGKDDSEVRETLIDCMKEIGQKYPNAGYGGMFYHWVLGKDRKPYNSYGNGAAMRISPCAWIMNCGFYGRTGVWPINGSARAELSAAGTAQAPLRAVSTTAQFRIWHQRPVRLLPQTPHPTAV